MMPGRLIAIVLCAFLAEAGGDRGVEVAPWPATARCMCPPRRPTA